VLFCQRRSWTATVLKGGRTGGARGAIAPPNLHCGAQLCSLCATFGSVQVLQPPQSHTASSAPDCTHSLPLSCKMYIYSSFWSVGIRCHILHALAIVALVEFICVQITSIKYIILKQDFCYSKGQKELDITCCIYSQVLLHIDSWWQRWEKTTFILFPGSSKTRCLIMQFGEVMDKEALTDHEST